MIRDRILTVVTPAASYDLVTLIDLKSDLGIATAADDAFLLRAIARASQIVANFCNRTFAVEGLRDDFLAVHRRGPGMDETATLSLSRFPVAASPPITVIEAGLALGPADFRVDAQAGEMIRIGADGALKPWSCEPISVSYSAGVDPVPADLQDAVTSLVKVRHFERSRDPMVRSVSIAGVMDTSYWIGGNPGASSGLPPEVEAVLGDYRVPVMRRG